MTIKIEIDEPKSWFHLSHEDTRHLDTIAHRISKTRKILVVTGAGVSCNAGIPDFRSKDGLYNLVKLQHPNAVVKGKDLFDRVLFSDEQSAAVFYTFMAELRKCILKAKPTQAHKFIKMLKDKKKLMRCYTQNIDRLEEQMGLVIGGSRSLKEETALPDLEHTNSSQHTCSKSGPKKSTKSNIMKSLDVIQLHGDIHSLKCNCCASIFSWTGDYTTTLTQGYSPECPDCLSKSEGRRARGMRSTAIGGLRPNIVLYGEEHPHGDVIGTCIARDARSKPDVMLIIGTTMKVLGLKKLVRDIAKSMKDNKKKTPPLVVLVNKTDIGLNAWEDVIDFHVKADCDEWIRDLKGRVPELFAVQTKIDEFVEVAAQEEAVNAKGAEVHDIIQVDCGTKTCEKVQPEMSLQVFEVQKGVEIIEPAVDKLVPDFRPFRRTRSATGATKASVSSVPMSPPVTPRRRLPRGATFTSSSPELFTVPSSLEIADSHPINAYLTPTATPDKKRSANFDIEPECGSLKNKYSDDGDVFNDVKCPTTRHSLFTPSSKRRTLEEDCVPIGDVQAVNRSKRRRVKRG